MQKLAITIILTVIALALGTTTTTTTMQIQPAYSQPSHCFTEDEFLRCTTPGKDASVFQCDPLRGCGGGSLDPNQVGPSIGGCHVNSAKGSGECTVTKTPPSSLPGPE
jgi:hypothetical protein